MDRKETMNLVKYTPLIECVRKHPSFAGVQKAGSIMLEGYRYTYYPTKDILVRDDWRRAYLSISYERFKKKVEAFSSKLSIILDSKKKK